MATKAERQAWVEWLKDYGLGQFFDAFVSNAQGAQSTCVYCREHIYLDIVEGGGVPDWKTSDGDYGCPDSPETCKEGMGSHFPERIN